MSVSAQLTTRHPNQTGGDGRDMRNHKEENTVGWISIRRGAVGDEEAGDVTGPDMGPSGTPSA